MADEEKQELYDTDYGNGNEEPMSKEELAYAQLLTEKKALVQKHAYEASPQYKVKKYVTPMRSFTKDVLGFVKKLPRYEEQAKTEYGKLKSEVAKLSEEEKAIERDLSKTLGGEAVKGAPKEDWSMGFGKPSAPKTEPVGKKPRKGWDFGFDDMKF
jgi:hypothetical protein